MLAKYLIPWRYIYEFEMVPRCMGISYLSPEHRQTFCVLMPFHWPVRWTRYWYLKFRFPEMKKWESFNADANRNSNTAVENKGIENEE